MELLATTNRGLETAAISEIRRLTGAEACVHHPGWVAFEGEISTLVGLNTQSRTLHRVFVQLVDASIGSLSDLPALVESAPLTRFIETGQTFGVDSTRIGTHDFGSPDVSDVVGQAVIDTVRDATGHRLAVDLDDPDVRLHATVREDRFTLAIDTTGEKSLHRRPYRVCDHPAPIRPTMAAAMLELIDYDGTQSLADPFCGCGTIPIETALAASGRSPNAGRASYAFQRLSFVDEEPVSTVPKEPSGRDRPPRIVAADRDSQWVSCTGRNVRSAGVDVDMLCADATQSVPDVDVIATDLPFNIRTNHGDLRVLYRQFVDAVEAATCERLVVLTTRPDLVPLEPDESITFRDGRLDMTILIASV